MIRAKVHVGVGAWVAHGVVELSACPHVGDHIEIGNEAIQCDYVQIGKEAVLVRCHKRFTDAEMPKETEARWAKYA